MNDTISLQITGMHCESCEKIISAELAELPGVRITSIDAKSGKAELETSSDTTDQAILDAVSKAGYRATVVERKKHAETAADVPEVPLSEAPDISDTFEKKIVDGGTSLKVRLESSAAAEGEFHITNGHPTFTGKVSRHRKGEFEVPKDDAQINAAVDELLSSNKISQLFALLSPESSGSGVPHQTPLASPAG